METCVWEQDENADVEYYETECGSSFFFQEGNVVDNDFHFCPYCGRVILVQP